MDGSRVTQKKRFTGMIISGALVVSLILMSGCEALVRKFTRKTKKETSREEMVLVPEEYKRPNMTKEESYRQSFLFWQSWQGELIESLAHSNHKKQVDCADEAIKNLEQLRTMLNKAKQDKLDVYLGRLKVLRGTVADDTYGRNTSRSRFTAERIRMGILRDFSYLKVKDDLI